MPMAQQLGHSTKGIHGSEIPGKKCEILHVCKEMLQTNRSEAAVQELVWGDKLMVFNCARPPKCFYVHCENLLIGFLCLSLI